MPDLTIHDCQWLVDEGASAILQATNLLSASQPVTSVVDKLRKTLSPVQTHLVLEQVELRKKAAAKFSGADRMFFTDVKLQQSTSEAIAKYKATKYSDGDVADLCCGIGGDSIGLVNAQVQRSFLHVDLDPVCCKFTYENLKAYGLNSPNVECDDVANVDLAPFSAWHLDPDRRVGGKRTAAVEFGSPNEAAIRSMLEVNSNAMIKLAPACVVPDDWAMESHVEWIGHEGECKQQVARFGELASQAGMRTATVLGGDGAIAGQVSGSADAMAGFVEVGEGTELSKIQGCIYEPHAAVRAAGLTNSLANELGLKRLAAKQSYLVGDAAGSSNGAGGESLLKLVAGFEIVATLPFDRKRIRRELEAMMATSAEVKTQTKLIDALQEQKRLNSSLRNRKPSRKSNASSHDPDAYRVATVIAVKLREQLVAVVAFRI